jgi:hypothetical protein
MKHRLTAALAATLSLFAGGSAQAAFVFDYPPMGFVQTTFGWEEDGGPVHGIGTQRPPGDFVVGDTEWIVNVPEEGGLFLFVQLYTSVFDTDFALSLNGDVLHWDGIIGGNLPEAYRYWIVENVPLLAGPNVFTVNILKDGVEDSFLGPLGPHDLRFAALNFNTDPGVLPAIPLPAALPALLGAFGLLAGLTGVSARRRSE